MQEIKMPNAGQTTDEAQIVKIYAAVGAQVKRGDVLMEAETDKAVLPVESYLNGVVLDVLVAEGDKVFAGTPLLIVGKEEEKASYHRGGQSASASPEIGETAQTAQESTTAPDAAAVDPEGSSEDEEYIPIMPGAVNVAKGAAQPGISATVDMGKERPVKGSGKSFPAMPGAKVLAREKGVSLSGITPKNGSFITKRDVMRAASVGGTGSADKPYAVMPMSRMRAAIGRRMLQSKLEIPTWQCTTSINMTACKKLREDYRERQGIKLSYNDILAKAIAAASVKYPLVNARYEEDEIRIYRHTNVGLAVAGEDALYVPVVRDVEEKSLPEISAAFKDLVERARKGRLLPDEMGCGSITISNLGMYDVDHFIAIDNPPESAILAVGSIRTAPWWNGESFVPVQEMTVTGSFDHRMIDGAYGAAFLKELKTLLEDPFLILL